GQRPAALRAAGRREPDPDQQPGPRAGAARLRHADGRPAGPAGRAPPLSPEELTKASSPNRNAAGYTRRGRSWRVTGRAGEQPGAGMDILRNFVIETLRLSLWLGV